MITNHFLYKWIMFEKIFSCFLFIMCSAIQEPFTCDNTIYCSNLIPLNCTSRIGRPNEILQEKKYSTILPARPRDLHITTNLSKSGDALFDITILWRAPDDASVRYLNGFDVKVISPNIRYMTVWRQIISLSGSISTYKDCENDIWFYLRCKASDDIRSGSVIVSSVPKPSHTRRQSSKDAMITFNLPYHTSADYSSTNISNLTCSQIRPLKLHHNQQGDEEENKFLQIIVTVVLLVFVTVAVIIIFIWRKGSLVHCKPKQRNGEEGFDVQYNNQLINNHPVYEAIDNPPDKEESRYYKVGEDGEAVTIGEGSVGIPSLYTETKSIFNELDTRSDFITPSEIYTDENFNPSTVAVDFNYGREQLDRNHLDERHNQYNFQLFFENQEIDESEEENDRITDSDNSADGISV